MAINPYTQTLKIMLHQQTQDREQSKLPRIWIEYSKYIIMTLGIVTSLLAAQVTFAGNGDNAKPRPGKKMKIIRNASAYKGVKLQYVEITGGYGIWVQPDQNLFKALDRPFYASIEIGNTLSPLSFGLAASVGSRFDRDSVIIDPDYTFAFAKYKLSQLLPTLPPGLEVYAMGGVGAWRSNLDNLKTSTSEFSIPGGQKDQGIGGFVGAGVQYRYRNFGLGAQFHWLIGKGSYELANGSKAGALIGSKQINVVMSYRLVWGQQKINCPIYSK